MNDGILLIDKPAGISSARVVSRIKRCFGFKKVGHTGTLDPFATGLMVITIGKATRLSRFFLDADKAYEARLTLGASTDTLDLTGEVVVREGEKRLAELEAGLGMSEVKSVCKAFTGELMQVPPVYSALKQDGVPLYKLARKGQAVEKPPRQVVVHENALNELLFPHIDITVICSKGTYIRSLARDMAEALGTVGHLTALRRTETTGFRVEEALTLEAAENTDKESLPLISMADALSHLPAFTLSEAEVAQVAVGAPLAWRSAGVDAGEAFCRVLGPDGSLVAMVESAKNGDDHKYCCVFAS
ncbi:MAG: tRNA pseudouridine(55) synthase TruB [Desulfobacterales bacterium]|nr:tRNA pseudouridine(55) synthase TruB [Desulfobacterales bacterium]